MILAALEAMFYFYAAGSLIAYMLEDEFASSTRYSPRGATFTLLAWAFAYVYVVCQALFPGSFSALANSADPRTWMELLFLSFTTLSGVGLGDIVPVLPMARALVMIEEFTGVMYLALVVSRLIAMSVTTIKTVTTGTSRRPPSPCANREPAHEKIWDEHDGHRHHQSFARIERLQDPHLIDDVDDNAQKNNSKRREQPAG